MASWDDNNRIEVVQNNAICAERTRPLVQAVLDRIPRAAESVLIGEASHGTEDFYRMRAELTKMLIKERGFNAVVVEADFPDAFRVNMYVKGLSKDGGAEEALSDFQRFPTWMWRNTVVTNFVDWLRDHNKGQPLERQVGFYGMDVYSLHSSAAKVIEFLQQVDPEAANRAKSRYKCFDRFGADTMAYAYAVGVGGSPPCTSAALDILRDVSKKTQSYSKTLDGAAGEELAFAAECNAAVVKGAEAYYRNMFFGEELTWNLRDGHFLETVKAIRTHLGRRGHEPKLVLWAHNSHLGDARATDMGQQRGEINIGQLMRQEFGMPAVYNIGFTTHTGTVAAADDWDTPVQLKAVRKSMPGSWEQLFHKTGLPDFALDMHSSSTDLRGALTGPLLERAIGVIYRPKTERQSHYFYADLAKQFDCIVHMDTTTALTPLEVTGPWETDAHVREDAPETFPFAL